VAANISRRGTTVLNKEEMEFEIASERKFIEKQKLKKQAVHDNNLGVRPGGISSDLAAFDMAIERAEARIALHEKNIRELEK